jgi:meso-butanediol dehydrogenase / (S,S)-butanediol dehydrogenase / diacetyl reductase
MSGIVGHPPEVLPNFAHAAAKGAVISLTRQLAVEGAPFKIRANSISPGVIISPGTAPLLKDPSFKAGWLPMIPMKRLGECEEVVKVALFLASDDSSYVTGANLVVDGGLTIN